jgi:hypothetical protein
MKQRNLCYSVFFFYYYLFDVTSRTEPLTVSCEGFWRDYYRCIDMGLIVRSIRPSYLTE